MAITRIDKAMLKGSTNDGLGPDHIQMEPNPCGVVFALKLDEQFRATSAEVGVPSLIEASVQDMQAPTISRRS